jgi:hypothetical protein
MKYTITKFVLVLLCIAIVTGCGESERKQAAQELEQMKQKCADAIAALDAAQQNVASLNGSLAELEKTIQGLNDSVKAAKATVAEKDARVSRLMDLEQSALDDAEAAAKAGDTVKALTAYKAFVRDFPFSQRVADAKKMIDREKWIADAPYRAAVATQARTAYLAPPGLMCLCLYPLLALSKNSWSSSRFHFFKASTKARFWRMIESRPLSPWARLLKRM